MKKIYRWPKTCEKSSTPLITRVKQIKTMRYHFTPFRGVTIKRKKKKKPEIPNVGEDVESEPLCTTVKWCSHYGKVYDVSSKN